MKMLREECKRLKAPALLIAIGIGAAYILDVSGMRCKSRFPEREIRARLQQVAVGLSNYVAEYHSLPPVEGMGQRGRPMHSWRMLVLPWMGDEVNRAAWEQYKWELPWNSAENLKVAAGVDSFDLSWGWNRIDKVSIVALQGERSLWAREYPDGKLLGREGLANTIVVVAIRQVDREPLTWSSPLDPTVDDVFESRGTESRIVGCVFGDGSVHMGMSHASKDAISTMAGASPQSDTNLLGFLTWEIEYYGAVGRRTVAGLSQLDSQTPGLSEAIQSCWSKCRSKEDIVPALSAHLGKLPICESLLASLVTSDDVRAAAAALEAIETFKGSLLVEDTILKRLSRDFLNRESAGEIVGDSQIDRDTVVWECAVASLLLSRGVSIDPEEVSSTIASAWEVNDRRVWTKVVALWRNAPPEVKAGAFDKIRTRGTYTENWHVPFFDFIVFGRTEQLTEELFDEAVLESLGSGNTSQFAEWVLSECSRESVAMRSTIIEKLVTYSDCKQAWQFAPFAGRVEVSRDLMTTVVAGLKLPECRDKDALMGIIRNSREVPHGCIPLLRAISKTESEYRYEALLTIAHLEARGA